MNVKITRIDESLPLPRYETEGSVGFDFVCRETIEIPSRSLGLLPGNVVVAVPQGYMLIVSLRSSTPKKHGLLMPHGIGVIDHDYCGPQDEVKIQVYNFKDEPAIIERGTRIAQGIFVHIERAVWEEVGAHGKKTRGGFGSTG